MSEKIITKKDDYTIEIEQSVKEEKSYTKLLEERKAVEQDITFYENIVAKHQTRLAEVDFLISEADKLGIAEEAEVAEAVIIN